MIVPTAALFSLLSLPLFVTAFTYKDSCPNTPTCPRNPSVSSSTPQSDTSSLSCCGQQANGTLVLVTQFWDTDAGPDSSWTIHGLWPDYCNGQYPANCDNSRAVTASQVSSTLAKFNEKDLTSYMNTYWVSDQGSNSDFWAHEYSKHAVCFSPFNPGCYTNYSSGQELVDFFQTAVDAFKLYPTYSMLSQAGIKPSNTTTYTRDKVQAAIVSATGFKATLNCNKGYLNEVFYYAYAKGRVQDLQLTPVQATAPGSCASTFKYPLRGALQTTYQ